MMTSNARAGGLEGSYLSLLRRAAVVAVIAGAVGSFGLMLHVGRHQKSLILIGLFTVWELSPFVALVCAHVVSRDWSALTRTTTLSVVIPMLGASFATASVLLATSVVRLYDLSVAMTNGGPGVASEVPAKFVMDHLFERGNLGLATAAATSMLITVAAVVGPWLYWQSRRTGRAHA